MIKKLLTILILGLSTTVIANPYTYKVTRVIDGDTVAFEAPFMPDPLKKELSIRVLGVDTPEKGHRAKCPAEDAKGQAATAFTKKKVADAKSIKIELKEHDKYGGRVLGDVIIDGERLSQLLIKNGFARPYFGEAKSSWCN